MLRFEITSFGCKVNQCDGLSIAAALSDAGLQPAQAGQTPDLVVVNTCCVTATAMRKSRQAIRRAVRNAPSARVLVTGCYGNYHKQRIRELLRCFSVPPQRILIAAHHDDLAGEIATWLRSPSLLLYETVESLQGSAPHKKLSGRGNSETPKTLKVRRKQALTRQARKAETLPSAEHFPGHQRAFVKVQDGCDAFCNYCVVPYTRPRVWSKTIPQVLDECRRLVQAGHKEIVLCGVFLGAFGRNTAIRRKWGDAPAMLGDLLQAVAELPGLWRVRLSSLEPGDLTDELLDVMRRCPTVAPHLHLPLQSGSPRILRRMNRQYTAGEFRQKVQALKCKLDRPAITTDILVGYPGETDDDFAQTLALAEEAGFSKIHIFPFSPIEPTAAWLRQDEAPPTAVVRRRQEELERLESRLAMEYRRQFIGETMEALVEASRPSARTRRAMTDRYLKVSFTPPPEDMTGRVVRLRITAATPTGLQGQPA